MTTKRTRYLVHYYDGESYHWVMFYVATASFQENVSRIKKELTDWNADNSLTSVICLTPTYADDQGFELMVTDLEDNCKDTTEMRCEHLD